MTKIFSLLTAFILLVLFITGCSQVSTVTLPPSTVYVPASTVTVQPSTITVTQTIVNTVTVPASTSTSKPSSPTQTIKITASELYAEYNANPIAADLKYKNNLLEISGYIYMISEDRAGEYYVLLAGAGIYQEGIECFFDSKYAPELALLNNGQSLAVDGTCQGLEGINVYVIDCALAQTQ